MGAAESKQGERINSDDIEKRRNSREQDSGTTTALAVGAAVGTVLLWGVSRYRSNDSDVRVDHHDHDDCPHESPISNYFQNLQVPSFNPEQNSTLKILSYNVCSREDYEINERMKAIGALVQLHSPHFICFQEITPYIYNIFQGTTWWGDYHCSMSEEEATSKQYFCILLSKFRPATTIKAPLGNSKMGRELCVTENKVKSNKSLVVATSHLKSPCPDPSNPNSQYHQFKRERLLQAKEALIILQKYPDVIFCGDMNWNDKKDGEFPLPDGWVDAWTELRGEENGYTWDTQSNEMLYGRPKLQRRLDRILCNLKGFRLDNIEIIGKEAIPDVYYERNKKQLSVLPSDHYGLLLTICT